MKLPSVSRLRRWRRPKRAVVEALEAKLNAERETSERYKQITVEMGVALGRLRDARDNYKLQWEMAAAELRRPKSGGACIPQPRADTRHGALGTGSASTPLRVLCVGTGRDGTTSLSRIMQDLFDRDGSGATACHEWASRELNIDFCELKETGDLALEDRIRELFRTCPHSCVVGNGYAAVLPILAQELCDQVTIVHLRRRDRAACIASLVENATIQPQNHRYYADVPAATAKRPAAFHFGEMSRDEWDALSLHDKFAWYYDKTHALIEKHKPLFANTLSVDTEDLADESVRAALAQAAGYNDVPRAFHVNRFVDLRFVPPERHSWVQRLLGTLDVQKLAHDDLYGLRQVLNEFVYHMAHFPDEGPNALDELGWTLSEAHQLLACRMDDLRELMDRIGRSPARSPDPVDAPAESA